MSSLLSYRIHSSALLWLALVTAGGHAFAAEPAHDYDALRSRAERTLERVALLLPNNEVRESPRVHFWMSPLILTEMPDDADSAADFVRFGPLHTNDWGRTAVDSGGRLTVYLYAGKASIDGQPYQQLIHLWFYPATEEDQPPTYRGVRQILDEHGFGILWEPLASDGKLREFYIAESLEKAAAKQYGEPLPGRRFSIESQVADHPEAVVIRAVGEGPQPMGPYVCLDRESQSVITLRCRCEPVHVDRYIATLHYQLETVKGLDKLLPDAKLAQPNLDERFRWPRKPARK